jgi:hypothetical protein
MPRGKRPSTAALRAAGPIGGVVGAAVGGAVGAVDGVFGIPDHHRYRCRGFYDRYDRFHCFRQTDQPAL